MQYIELYNIFKPAGLRFNHLNAIQQVMGAKLLTKLAKSYFPDFIRSRVHPGMWSYVRDAADTGFTWYSDNMKALYWGRKKSNRIKHLNSVSNAQKIEHFLIYKNIENNLIYSFYF